MNHELTIQLVCDVCGEPLSFELDSGFAHHGEYHECFGETVRDLAMVDIDGVRPVVDGIDVKVIDQ